MDIQRRDFLKKSGLVTLAGFIPAPVLALEELMDKGNNLKNSFIIKNAHILTMDDSIDDLNSGSILVQNGEIVAIAEQIEVPDGLEVIDGKDAIVMPGLIDCHWHLWTSLMRSMSGDTEERGYFPMTAKYSRYFTPEDMKIAAGYAAAEALNAGITTITDYNHNARTYEYVLAGCEALAEAGIRARVEYNGYRDKPAGEPTDFQGIEKVKEILEQEEKFALLSLGLGSRGAGYEYLQRDWEQARDLGMRISIHASSNREQIGQIQQLEKKGILGKDVNIIHGNAITTDEIQAVVRREASITMTPYSEMRIGYGFPRPNDLIKAGINVSLGVDSTALSGNADLFSIMKLIQNVANAKAEDEYFMDPHKLLEMATINGARTLGIDNFTGSLTPGKRADIIMLKKNDLNFSSGSRVKNLVVEAAQPQNVDFVSIDGKILKQNGKLTSINPEDLIAKAEAAFLRLENKVE